MTIKHISLDFWNTVGKPNPVFAEQRTALLSSMFGLTQPSAKAIYSAVKNQLDTDAEQSGSSSPRDHNIEALIVMLGGIPNKTLISEIGFELDTLFRKYPPHIDPEIIRACNMAHSRGVTLSIGSNTNFINGFEISRTMDIPFKFEIYSDAIGVSKPHVDFFAEIFRHSGVASTDIVHIGDHPICDGGAARYGMQFRLVENYNTAQIINQVLDTL